MSPVATQNRTAELLSALLQIIIIITAIAVIITVIK